MFYWLLFAVIVITRAMGKMRNCGMRKVECGIKNAECDKPRDCWLSADYHTSLSTGSAVKCIADQKCGKA